MSKQHVLIPQSSQALQRKVSLIGSIEKSIQQKPSFEFIKLKKQKRIQIGSLLRNAKSEVELFACQKENVGEKCKLVKENIVLVLGGANYQGYGHDSQHILSSTLVQQRSYIQSIGCEKFHRGIQKEQFSLIHQTQLELKSPTMISPEKSIILPPVQKILQPHQLLYRQNLPPLLFQANLQSKYQPSLPFTVPHSQSQGKLICGRIAEGIDPDRLNFLNTQKQLQQIKIKNFEKPRGYNLALKKMNRIKNIGSGNILGKAIQRINQEESLRKKGITKDIERSMIREKERQIDGLIFKRENNFQNSIEPFVTDTKDQMDDFI